MKITEFRQKSKEELISLVREKQLRMNEIGFLLKQNKIKNVKEGAAVKKDIAQIQTIIHSMRA